MELNSEQKASDDKRAQRFWDVFYDPKDESTWKDRSKKFALRDNYDRRMDMMREGTPGRFFNPYYHPDPLWKQHCKKVMEAETDAFWEQAKKENLLIEDIKTRLEAYDKKYIAMLRSKVRFSDDASNISNNEANDDKMDEDNDEEAKDAAMDVNNNGVNDNVKHQDTGDEDHNRMNECESADDGAEVINNNEAKHNEMDNDEPADDSVNDDENRKDYKRFDVDNKRLDVAHPRRIRITYNAYARKERMRKVKLARKEEDTDDEDTDELF